MLLRLSAGAARDPGDPSHPRLRLTVRGGSSDVEVDEIAALLGRGDCLHLTVTVPTDALLPAIGRHGPAEPGRGVHECLADLAAVLGHDAHRVWVRIEHQPPALSRWWGAWAWRRGVGGADRRPARERRLDELLAPTQPHPDPPRTCADRPHLLAVAAVPLSWDVIDELHRRVSAGLETHLVLTLPRSPASRDAGLHALWARRMALDVADREREVAQLWPGSQLVRIEVVGEDSPPGRVRRSRR